MVQPYDSARGLFFGKRAVHRLLQFPDARRNKILPESEERNQKTKQYQAQHAPSKTDSAGGVNTGRLTNPPYGHFK